MRREARRAAKWALIVAVAASGGCTPSRAASGGRVADAVEVRLGRRVTERDAGAASEAIEGLLSRPLEADRAVAIALLASDAVQAELAAVSLARAEVAGALLMDNPEAELELRWPVTGEDEGDPSLEISLMQNVAGLFTYALRRGAADATLEAAETRAVAGVVRIAGEVRAAFHRLQAARQIVEMRGTIAVAAETSYDLARRLHAAGNITDLALAQEHALYEETRLALGLAEVNARRARAELNAAMGLWGPAAAGWKLAGRLPEIPEEDDVKLASVERVAIEKNLELSAMRRELEGLGDALTAAEVAAFLPELGLGVSAEREGDGAWGVGPAVGFEIPIFNRQQGPLLEAESRQRRIRMSYGARAVEIRATAVAARDRLRFARARAEHIREVLMPLRQTIVDEMVRQYNAMNVGLFGLLEAKRDQIETGRQWVEAVLEYWLAHIDVEQLRAGHAPPMIAGEPAMSTPESRGGDREDH